MSAWQKQKQNKYVNKNNFVMNLAAVKHSKPVLIESGQEWFNNPPQIRLSVSLTNYKNEKILRPLRCRLDRCGYAVYILQLFGV